jgi:GH25 family lysozyme M1 (1,4-beta-N-acetylmuramidase)
MILKTNTGIDVSDYQPGLQIGTLNPLPRFVVMKATESMTFRCDTTIDFAAQCKALGIPYGFYHFWQNADPYKQVSNYIQQVNLAGGFERFPPVLDLEVGLVNQDANIKIWLDVVEDVAGMRPILYSNKYHFDMIANNFWFKTYDVWTAAYPSNPDLWLWCPPIYSETRAKREIIWQYASTYRYPNYSRNSVDTNVAITDFLNEIGAIKPPTGVPPMTYKSTAIYSDTRLRTFHNTLSTSTSIGYYPAGTVFEGDNIWTATPADMVTGQVVGDKWLQTVKPLAGWVAIVHGGKTYCNLVTVTPPPPPPVPTGDVIVTVTINEQAKTHNTSVTWADGSQG